MGWSTAYHLLELEPELDVLVIEKDPSLRYASTLLSDGNVRVQFNLEENIAMSLYAIDTLQRFPEEMAFGDYRPDPQMRRQGNLFLASAETKADALAGVELQNRLGAESEWLDLDAIESRYPALHSTTVVGGTFGPHDGSVDPATVVDAYRRNAVRAGAALLPAEVESLVAGEGTVDGVRLNDGSTIRAKTVVICAGAWSTGLLATVRAEVPVEPVMRTVYVVSGEVPGTVGMPSTFLPNGLYVIPEGEGTWLIAWSKEDDPIGFDFSPAPRSRFYELIWPALIENLPAFDRLEVTTSWCGLYEQNRLDANGIIGRWPAFSNLYLATGFSGHGFQQAPAVGRYLGEQIVGRKPSLDLSRLGPQRILAGEPVLEHAGRII